MVRGCAPPWALVTPPLSPGYAVAIMVFLLMLLFNGLSAFYFWWLSYWLGQGSGVSALGMGGGGRARGPCGGSGFSGG